MRAASCLTRPNFYGGGCGSPSAIKARRTLITPRRFSCKRSSVALPTVVRGTTVSASALHAKWSLQSSRRGWNSGTRCFVCGSIAETASCFRLLQFGQAKARFSSESLPCAETGSMWSTPNVSSENVSGARQYSHRPSARLITFLRRRIGILRRRRMALRNRNRSDAELVHQQANGNAAQTGKLRQHFKPSRSALLPVIQQRLKFGLLRLRKRSRVLSSQQAAQAACFCFRGGGTDTPEEFALRRPLCQKLLYWQPQTTRLFAPMRFPFRRQRDCQRHIAAPAHPRKISPQFLIQ